MVVYSSTCELLHSEEEKKNKHLTAGLFQWTAFRLSMALLPATAVATGQKMAYETRVLII